MGQYVAWTTLLTYQIHGHPATSVNILWWEASMAGMGEQLVRLMPRVSVRDIMVTEVPIVIQFSGDCAMLSSISLQLSSSRLPHGVQPSIYKRQYHCQDLPTPMDA